MIIINGTKKSGTHALLRLVDLFVDTIPSEVEHSHVPFSKRGKIKYYKHIHISRSPRNVLVSLVRRVTKENVTEDELMYWMSHVLDDIRSFMPWTLSKKCLNVRFEELLSDPAEIKRISDYLGLPLAKDHFKNIWGRTRTSTFNLSKWHDHWTDDLEKKWFEYGGHALESILGYDPYKKYVRRANG